MEALANLAHELRSPVQAILGYLDILREELSEELGDRHTQILERLNANAHDLAQTVENVMDFSVADAMAEASEEEEIGPQDLIEDLAPALQAANDSKGLEIRFDLERAPAIFRARRRPIRAICSTSQSTQSSLPIEATSRLRYASPIQARTVTRSNWKSATPDPVSMRCWWRRRSSGVPSFRTRVSALTAAWGWAWQLFSAMWKRSARKLWSRANCRRARPSSSSSRS